MFVIIGYELIEDLLSFPAVLDLVFFTKKWDTPLKVVKEFFDLFFGLGLAFPSIHHFNIQRLEEASELDFRFVLPQFVLDMNPLVKDESKDGIIIQVVGQREAVSKKGVPDELKVLEGGLDRDDLGPDDLSAIVIFGQDEVVFDPRVWKPKMVRRVVLE